MEVVNPGPAARSRPELVAEIRAEIEAGGRMTFARFMELALTHPLYGYYTATDAAPGFGGDFLTAPETHRMFGTLLARQIVECWERLGRPAPFVVREFGAGTATLALTVLAGLRDESPDVLNALRYELSDVNDKRLAEGLALAEAAGFGGAVVRATDAPVVGVLLANELLDALPVHRLVVCGDELREVYVVWRDDWFADEIGDLSDPRLAEPLSGLSLADGQRLEVSLAAAQWTETACRTLERGYAILIDYGYKAAERYDPVERRDGLLRTYWQHIAGDDPYDRVGLQDITAHVDFSAVQRAAEAAGCDMIGLTTQAHFVAGLGADELLMRLQQTAEPLDYIRARETLMHLLDPRGLGRFRVLITGRNVDREPPLRGLSFKWP